MAEKTTTSATSPLFLPKPKDNSVTEMDSFNSLREDGVGEIIVFVLLSRHIGQHHGIMNLRVFLFQFPQDASHGNIKPPLIAYIESIHPLIGNQIHQYLPQIRFYRFWAIPVSEESTRFHVFTPFELF